MKKIISIALVLFLAAGFCFAAPVTRTVEITGTIKDGDTEKPSDVNPGDVVVDGPIKIVANIITSTDIAAPDGEKWPSDGIAFDSEGSSFTADLTHELTDTSIDSFTVVYGAYGNVSADNVANTSVTISATSDGWELNGSSAKSQMELFVSTTPDGESTDIMYGTTGDNSGDIKVVTKGGDTAGTLYIVGNTKVTWSKAGGVSTPTAGSYTATITFTFTAS